jgi:hypothetical protein
MNRWIEGGGNQLLVGNNEIAMNGGTGGRGRALAVRVLFVYDPF